MRIRTILLVAFCFAILVPTVLYGVWSYRHAVRQEMADVEDRHLLIAENLGSALERYHDDLVSSVKSISAAMVTGNRVPRMAQLMRGLHVKAVFIVDKDSGEVQSKTGPGPAAETVSEAELAMARSNARLGKAVFSPVIAGLHGGNELLIVLDYGRKLAIARLDTAYFVKLAGAVAFGEKGHAAIVDREGNILAHPMADWIAERKNIAKISVVQRMMAGETGIEKFYSPALKGDMIAGFTTVSGPGWGIMAPQPISELYAKALWQYFKTLSVLATGISLAFLIVAWLLRSFLKPLESMVRRLRMNAETGELGTVPVQSGLLPIRELTDFQQAYNHMATQVSEAHGRLHESAYRDSVTGLPNRGRFNVLAEEMVQADLREGVGGVLIYLDLDDFKEINDLHGHDVGDDYLRHCAEKLVATSRIHSGAMQDRFGSWHERGPLIARMGGDEFALLYPGLEGDLEIQDFLSNLIREIRLLSDEMGVGLTASASLGCAVYPKDASKVDDLIKLADIAMYHAKKEGKNRTRIYEQAIGRQTTAEIRQAVLDAIRNDELVLEYQPKVRASDWKPCGAEALVRWNHPERGRLAPDLWLPSIIDSKVISRLGEWVVERALEDRPRWADADSELKLALNIGARHFVSPGFAEWLESTLASANIDSKRVVIEITEDTLLTADDRADGVLNRLHDRKFAMSVDDFGKGYSNIARLAQLPVDQLKIDRSIVAGAMRDKRVEGFLHCILDLARALDCETVAEGVETREQAEFMSKCGADILQGYYFSKSLPVDELVQWLADHAEGRDHDTIEPMKLAVGLR